LRLFRSLKHDVLERPGSISAIDVEPAHYVPEHGVVLRYLVHAQPEAASKVVYGKIQRHITGAETERVMRALWAVARESEGRLRVARPLGHLPGLEVFLQEAVDGEALGGDRGAPELQAGAVAAADALATIHAAGLAAD